MQTSGRGGDKLYLAVAEGQSVHGEITGKGHFTYQGIVEQIDIDIDASIKLSWQESARQHRRWRVPAQWAHGWLAWGSYGYQFHWERVRTDVGCTVEVLAHGTGKLPAKHLGFHTGRGITPPETG